VEARLLASGWFRGRLARAVADGVLDYARPPAADQSGGDAPGAPAKGEAILASGDTPVAPVEGEGILTGATAAAEGALPVAP